MPNPDLSNVRALIADDRAEVRTLLTERLRAIGVDQIDTSEHVLMGEGALQAGAGWEPHHLDMAQPESLTGLAAMIGVTRRIRLLSNVVIAPLRPAGLLAKMAATMHALSQGRYAMGVSVSWHRDEYDALNVPFEKRGRVLDDTLGACRVLWSEAPATFHSETVNFENMYCSPRPGPGERIPILLGGEFAPRLVRRVVSVGDGWLLFGGLGMTMSQRADAIAELKQAWADAGRDPARLELDDDITPVNGDVARSLEQVPELAEAGMTTVRVHLRRFGKSPDPMLPVLEEVVRRFEPYRSIEV